MQCNRIAEKYFVFHGYAQDSTLQLLSWDYFGGFLYICIFFEKTVLFIYIYSSQVNFGIISSLYTRNVSGETFRKQLLCVLILADFCFAAVHSIMSSY